MYGGGDENGEFNPFDDEPDDELLREKRSYPPNDIDLACFNCGGLLVELRNPYIYCSERCSREAESVRYARAVSRDGRILDPLVAEAVQIQLGLVVGGGYSERERALSKEQRAAIFERDGGRCRVCGTEATQIDHINEGADLVARNINDPQNLQAICDDCHRAKTLANFRPIDPEHREKADELKQRIDAEVPTRLSDDEQNWKTDWRRHAAERRALAMHRTRRRGAGL
jgi:hypothetical protein